jgi:hypothetical protein
MLDKFLTGENVKVNNEIAGRRHILRILLRDKNFDISNSTADINGAYPMELYSQYRSRHLTHLRCRIRHSQFTAGAIPLI